jgi:thiamine-monophosphate kinase
MRESSFLQHVYENAKRAGHVVVGPGDDCAVLDLGGQDLLLITTDQLIAGRHYDANSTSPELIARKALARSVSDIAAMAGRPIASVCTASFAPADEQLATVLFDAMSRFGAEWGAPLVGGDFALGDTTQFSTTVLGSVSRAGVGPILRSGARPGDLVWVTGRIGGSYETGHHLSFTPRHAAGLELRERLGDRLHAMIDVSDGLGRDGARIATATSVGLVIDAERVPLRVPERGVEASVADGEDYELLFTTSEGVELPSILGDGTEVVRIGRVVDAAQGVTLRWPDGRTLDVAESGWDHGS